LGCGCEFRRANGTVLLISLARPDPKPDQGRANNHQFVTEMVDSDLKAIEREAWRHDRTAR